MTSIAFSGNEKIVNQNHNTEQVKVENIDEYFELENCALTILHNEYNVVALQFPDELMSYANCISKALKKLTKKKIYILADTSYGSCCVDEVAASHYAADVIIHYGQSCLSYPDKIPVINIFGKRYLDRSILIAKMKETFQCTDENILLVYDVQYATCLEKCFDQLQQCFPGIVFSEIVKDSIGGSVSGDHSSTKFGRKYNLKCELGKYKILFIGDDGRTLYNYVISYNKNEVYSYNPSNKVLRKEDFQVNRYLMKRYYLIEKAKDAQIVGILMGTLGVARYKEILVRLKKVLKVANKKYYTFIVGKINPAKLANFMEIDIFVLIACTENTLIDSKEFYKPIVTPYEMEIACLNSRSWTGEYVTDFRDLLPGSVSYLNIDKEEVNSDGEPEFSFITGKLRNNKNFNGNRDGNSNEMVEYNHSRTVCTTNASEYLSSRTWNGLKIDSGNTEAKDAIEGRSGIAMNYVKEGQQ